MPILIIPLEGSDKVELEVPKWEEIQAQVTLEPPSIYLVMRDIAKHWVNKEEYKLPLEYPLPLDASDGAIKSYYSCYRGHLELDYGRAIYFEYYPNELLA